MPNESYAKNLHNLVNLLRETNALSDIDLYSNDLPTPERFPSHKVVLCSGIPYINSIINNPSSSLYNKHKLNLCLPIKAVLLNKILDFVYTGSVKLPEVMWDDFLVAAESLGININKDVPLANLLVKWVQTPTNTIQTTRRSPLCAVTVGDVRSPQPISSAAVSKRG